MTKPFIALAVFVATRISIPIFFFFNDTATTEIYTLSLHDALPISSTRAILWIDGLASERPAANCRAKRSEEHTSELQSRLHLVCRLLLEKKKNNLTAVTEPPSPSRNPAILPCRPPAAGARRQSACY